MATSALQRGAQEFEELYAEMERRGGGVLHIVGSEENGVGDGDAQRTAVTLVGRWREEQSALAQMKALLASKKTEWPARGYPVVQPVQKASGDKHVGGVEVVDISEGAGEAGAAPQRMDTDVGRSKVTDTGGKNTPAAKEATPATVAPRVQDLQDPTVAERRRSLPRSTSSSPKKSPAPAVQRRAPESPGRRFGSLLPAKRSSTARSSSRPQRGHSVDPEGSKAKKRKGDDLRKEEEFPCPVPGCGRAFKSHSTVNCHINTKHASRAKAYLPFPCPLCEYACGSSKTLTSHMDRVHGDDDE